MSDTPLTFRKEDEPSANAASGASLSWWQFFIDVGGTFTDVIARGPDGYGKTGPGTYKILSSGAVRGVVGPGSSASWVEDSRRIGDPADFWTGYEFEVLSGESGESCPTAVSRVVRFDAETGGLDLDPPLSRFAPGTDVYELRSHEEAPVVAIRYLMGLRLGDPIGPIDVRLGTTRATNALLERKGAQTALVTTKGFGDILKIGNQDRPALFDLHIRKRDELATTVVEIDERTSAAGVAMRSPDQQAIRCQLESIHRKGVQAVAICFLHAHVNPGHELMVADVARSVGFGHVSVSSSVSRMEKVVSRGDTTVVDAYLSPVIQGYIASLRRSLPDARLKLMTSSGGLIDATSASGKDTILSGPAGGVVGCAHISRQAGFDKTIGFDMGGTSTDVSRIEPPPNAFEYQQETVKAGVRIMTPMLAVETVAAGGGSMCHFDGHKLVVGPQSAGADPGPACYGRGGPLTVTDMNVHLGRVIPEYFPFRLDGGVIENRLATLRDEVNRTAGSSLSLDELAEGFVRIANSNMAAAIKRISVAKGYDVREYALTSFGGAGGQHACAVARILGMSRIFFNPFAGVLSALGIGVADVKRIGERSVDYPVEAIASGKLGPVFESIAGPLRAALRADGVDDVELSEARRSYDLCYTGQATLITVPAATLEQVREEFEARHRQLYGYCHEGREIEIRAIRVELTAVSSPPDVQPGPRRDRPLVAARESSMVVNGEPQSVTVYLREELGDGQEFMGPAVVVEETSTIVVDSGWKAAVTDQGNIVLTDIEKTSAREVVSAAVDPIQLELFNNQFAAIAEQMGTTLRRTALSTNVKERLDFSCAVFTPSGDLVVNAPHIPVHLGGMSDCVKALIADVGTFEPGDVYITNDPYRGGSHLNDVTVITPVLGEEGRRILFFVANRAHHAEIGGIRPGSMAPDSQSLAEEGVLIRAFRWIMDDRPRHEALRAVLTALPYPSRTPEENLADIAAQVAANRNGVGDLLAMMERYGLEVVHGYMRHIQTAAEKKMRRTLSKMADGERRFQDRLDDGTPISLTVTISGDHATFDFTGTGGVVSSNLNANRAIVSSAVLYCLRCLIDEDIPLNAGVLVPIDIILPECLLNPRGSADPRCCPAMGGGNVETSQRVVDCVFGALGTVAASQGTMNNLLVGNQRFGYYETICGGGGAGPGFNGADAVHTHMTNTRLTDPEVLESRYPLRLVRFAIRRGSGGAGRYRGGDGVVRELEFLEPLELSIMSQRRVTAPYGMQGGACGAAGRNLLKRAGVDEPVELPAITTVAVRPGDRLTIETPGGGGWGTAEPVEGIET